MAILIGLDLGQAQDFTAVAVVEYTPRWTDEVRKIVDERAGKSYRRTIRTHLPGSLDVRRLERLDVGTKYPAIVRSTVGMMLLPAFKDAPLLVDATGVGRGVFDLFKETPIAKRVVGVTVTAGDHCHFEHPHWRVPKRDLVGSAQIALQDQRLKIAQGIPYADVLIRELLNFKVKITPSANDTYSAWREGEHDDLAFALMLTCWWAAREDKRLQWLWEHPSQPSVSTPPNYDWSNRGMYR